MRCILHHTLLCNCGIGVIQNHFNKRLDVTPSELDETWYVSSACGFMKPDKILPLYVVWLPGYDPLKDSIFTTLAAIKIQVTSSFFITLQNELHHLEARRMGFHMVCCIASSD